MVSLRERALRGNKLIGVLVRMPAEELVEMSAVAGMDYVLIDCEHGPDDLISLRNHIALAEIHDVPVIVRVGENDPGQILRVLDQGAQGILAPHLDTQADAEVLISAAMYPPVGKRGFATYSRAGRFGATPGGAHRDWYLANTLVLGMIESPAGVAAVDEIVQTRRLDGIMIGPADLAATTGPEDQPVAEATALVNSATVRANLVRMDIVGSPAAAAAAFDAGAGMVVYNLTHTLMAHLRHLVDASARAVPAAESQR